ncbi:hypothetical protein CSW58_04455 [Caulobacter sp. B11]|uniref:hypothetical protein n=1 Tax=Caulobacter sp. B11 TaxID=2048899 RepID=UPI000C12CF9C|nr:hypothetical protein [Caulobacter sp. B11]PHY13629.1 hypothetical protein CSW58_04455 [Caulobacter sp. B11]
MAGRITDPDERIAMRADKRFDRLGAAGPDRFSPRIGAMARLKQVDALIPAHPALLAGQTARTEALIA